MRALRILLALAGALVVRLVLVGAAPEAARVVDPFLIVIVFQAMSGDVGVAVMAGALVGLTQDAVSGGLYGLHGFAGTVVGFVLARAARFLTLQKFYYIVLFFAAAVLLKEIVVQLLLVTLLQQPAVPPFGELVMQVLVAGLVGAAVVATVETVSGRFFNWRRGRRPRVSLE